MTSLEVVAIITFMTLVICPMLLWVLPDRRGVSSLNHSSGGVG
jgi:hypothetical protein